MKQRNKKSFKRIFIALILTIIAWIGLIYLESAIVSPEGKKTVITTINTVEKGKKITKENFDKYFKEKIVNGDMVVEKAATNKEELIGLRAKEELVKGVCVSTLNFTEKYAEIEKIKNPIELSFSVNEISQSVGGILRKGDLINISVNNSYDKTNEVVLNNVLVSKVFKNDGSEIEDWDTTSSATTINITIDKEDESKFNELIALGDIRVGKVK